VVGWRRLYNEELHNLHLPPSSAEIKECVDIYLYSPNTPSWLGA